MKKRGTKLPAYYLEKPMYPCIRLVRPMLGEQDASIQTNYIIIKSFEDEYRGNIRGKLNELSDIYKISKGNNDLGHVMLIMAQMNIISTFSVIDEFFKIFIDDYKKYKRLSDSEWKYKDSKNNQLDSLNQILYNFSQSQKNELLLIPEFELLDYYRLMRNYIIHKDSKILEKVHNKHEKLIDNYKNFFEKNYKLLPNSFEMLEFKDYFLYTRAYKYFVNKLNNIADLTLENIVEYAKLDKKFQTDLRGVENIKNVKIRARRIAKIRGYYRMSFSFGRDKTFENQFLDLYKKSDIIKWI